MASFRRTNKSHKVPNVKLRPALPSASSKSRSSASHDSGFESEHENSFVDTCPRPFRGVVLCATGINDKTAIFKQAFELGAQPLSDLTDKVTHLLAAEPGSAKYKCAMEYKLPIMRPSWITDSYEIWLRGDDVDLDESVKTHRLPTFSGVVLCISGIEDEMKRVKINKLVTSEGGTYVKDITRPVKVTHLLCASGIDGGSEKVRYAQRFNEKGEADIRIVWEEWFWDSLDMKGCCNEDNYSISKPKPVRKSTPEREQPAEKAAAVEERSSSVLPKPPVDTADLLNGDEEEHVLQARLPTVTMQAWEGMLRSRGFERRGNNFYSNHGSPGIQSQPSRIENVVQAVGQHKARPLTRHVTEGQKSVIAAFKRTDSFAPLAKDTSTQRQPRPFARVPTLPDAESFVAPEIGSIIVQGGQDLPVVATSQEATEDYSAEPVKKRPFVGLTFRPMGEARSQNVREAVEGAGGRVVPEDSDEDVNFIVVRLVSGSRLYRTEAEQQDRDKYRTECWLERCLNEGRICAPEEHILFVPLKVETPIPGADGIVLSHTGLTEEEACWMIKRLARALGFTIPNTFSRRSTHLLCPSRSGVKFEKAQEWGIPVVDMNWLTDIATSGIIASSSGSKTESDATHKAKSAPNSKGKEKAVAVDTPQAMGDITNNSPEPSQSSKSHDILGHTNLRDEDKSQAQFEPNGLLGLSEPAEEQSAATQPSGETRPDVMLAGLPRTPSKKSSSFLRRHVSLADLRGEMKTIRIPSSVSPSSVKTSSKPNSPIKLDAKTAVGLSDSINSLIKRPFEDAEIAERKLKRARPASRSTTVSEPAPEKQEPPASAARSVFDPFPHDEASLRGATGTHGDDMRVLYEDPAQHTEKQRLMKLLEGKEGAQEVWEVSGESQATPTSSSRGTRKSQARKAPTRRSTRVGSKR